MWLMCGLIVLAGCTKRQDEPQTRQDEAPCVVEAPAAEEELPPCPTVDEEAQKAAQGDADAYDIPRFAANSPFDVDYESPVPEDEKRLWANSFLWDRAPGLVVEKWLTEAPETAGKYVLIEFWATWCPPCRRSVTLLNGFHAKYKDELVVIGVSDETEADVRKLKEPQVQYYSAIDTQARTKKQLGVFGIPHVILLEPDGYVVWEGFPLLKGYELTDETIEHVLSVGRRLKQEQQAAGQ
jgi:thiol-disulfide isomerase/thioredoxin